MKTADDFLDDFAEEFSGVDKAHFVALVGAVQADCRRRVARVADWTRQYGAALKPRGADTYGEGMRDAKDQVAKIIGGDGGGVTEKTLRLALERCVEAMKMQEGRDSGVFHVNGEVAWDIWNKAKLYAEEVLES